MSEHEYHLQDGTPCTLETLCRKEPEWAANRLRALEQAAKKKRGPRSPTLLVDDAERLALREQIAAFRRAYLDEFRDDGGDDLSLITFVIVALQNIREKQAL